MREVLEHVNANTIRSCLCSLDDPPASNFLSCLVGSGLTPQSLLERFRQYGLVRVYYPKEASFGRAFLEFNSCDARIHAHTANETHIDDWLLRLFTCSAHALEDALRSVTYSTFEMETFDWHLAALSCSLPNAMQPSCEDAKRADTDSTSPTCEKVLESCVRPQAM